MSKSPVPGKPRPRSPRFDIAWRATLTCANWGFASRIAALNASQGGFFVTTSKPPVPGSRVELLLSLPNGTQLKVRGTVQHVVTPQKALTDGVSPGAGIKIDPEHEAEMLQVERLAAKGPPAAAEQGAKAAAPPPSAPSKSALPALKGGRGSPSRTSMTCWPRWSRGLRRRSPRPLGPPPWR